MASVELLQSPASAEGTDAGLAIGLWVDAAIAGSSNAARLQERLDAIAGPAALMRFLHRFVLFNDALAARVPFVAGMIHLTPDVFVDRGPGASFCRQVNGQIAAYVAEAASDEYRFDNGRNCIHQHLSQRFFNGVLAYCRADPASFDLEHPFPERLATLIKEARQRFLRFEGAQTLFQALGFHVGLEFFAHQEFNLVDAYLEASHPDLVRALKGAGGESDDYVWLALHTIVEIGHYRAGMQALKSALWHYRDPADAPFMAERIKEGFNAFIDLQARYYDAVLCDVG